MEQEDSTTVYHSNQFTENLFVQKTKALFLLNLADIQMPGAVHLKQAKCFADRDGVQRQQFVNLRKGMVKGDAP